MNESDTRLKLIDPVLTARWTHKRIRTEYYLTDGEIVVRGRMTTRKKPLKADYLLSCAPDFPIAIVEAKDTNHSVGAGLQQAMVYAQALDIPFAYSTNGRGFVEHDFFTGGERTLRMVEFPTPDELWSRYRTAKGITDAEEKAIMVPFHYELNGISPRYYQRVAVNRTVEIVAKGGKRVLLVMATGPARPTRRFRSSTDCARWARYEKCFT